MNLTVRESHHLFPITMQIGETHGDHSGLFFFDVDKLNETFGAACFKVPETAIVLATKVINGFSTTTTRPSLL